jgi:hypothetical protein
MTDDDSYDFEEEQQKMNEMFPNCKFSICIDIDEMNDIISEEPQIIIQCNPCNGYCKKSGNRIYIYVYNNGNGITNKDMIQAMIDANYDPDCNHIFLETWEQMNDVTFYPLFGS